MVKFQKHFLFGHMEAKKLSAPSADVKCFDILKC